VLSGTAPDSERPATFHDVLASREFRAVYAASTLSWVGDYLARAAVTALVYQNTHSVAYSAAAFAISYAPWLLGGSVLVSVAERYPYRTIMVACDVIRMVLMAIVGLFPHMPLAVVLLLLLASALFSPPFDAAKSATMPAILPGDRYVVGVALTTATAQPAQVVGYALGSAIAGVGQTGPSYALLLNAVTFAVSAILVRFGLRLRPAALDRARRSDLLHETVDGFKLVFTHRTLRFLVLLVFCGSLFAVVPEGLAAAWAALLTGHDKPSGWTQGVIMAAVPLGSILCALTVTRLIPPARRRRLLRPLGLATPLVLVPAVFEPRVFGIAVMAGLCGFAIGGLVPVANGEFVRELPAAYRARAFGVVQGGLQLLQGGAVLITGYLAHLWTLPVVVGLWSLGGVVLMIMLWLTGPSPVRVESESVTGVSRRPGTTPLPGTMES
jgi:MFS family permease